MAIREFEIRGGLSLVIDEVDNPNGGYKSVISGATTTKTYHAHSLSKLSLKTTEGSKEVIGDVESWSLINGGSQIIISVLAGGKYTASIDVKGSKSGSYTSYDDPHTLYLYDIKSGKIEQLASGNADWRAPAANSATITYWYDANTNPYRETWNNKGTTVNKNQKIETQSKEALFHIYTEYGDAFTWSAEIAASVVKGEQFLDAGKGDDWIQLPDIADFSIGLGLVWNPVKLVKAGAGNDLVTGGDADDRVDAGVGNNNVTGHAGNDTITSGSGADIIWADGVKTVGAKSVSDEVTGNDVVRAGDGGNFVVGGGGDDDLVGGAGQDIIWGDAVTFGAGTDHDDVKSGAGNDTINGGGGANWLYGGWGNDTITSGDGVDYIWADALKWDGASGRRISVLQSAGNDVISAGDGYNDIFAGAGNDTITGGKDVDFVWADGTETKDGQRQSDTGKGNDTVKVRDGNNTVILGAGRDILLAGSGDDLIWGDNVALNEAGDWEDVGANADVDDINAGDGANFVYAGGGEDTIKTGSGDDYIWGDGVAWNIAFDRLISSASSSFADKIDAGDGNNSIFGGGGGDTITAGDGNDIIWSDGVLLDGAGDRIADNTVGDDTVDAGDGNNLFQGSAGNDRLKGGNGIDTFNYQNGSLQYFKAGTVQEIDGGDNPVSAKNQDVDTLELEGSISDYKISVTLGTTWETTTTKIVKLSGNKTEYTFETKEIELAKFEDFTLGDPVKTTSKNVNLEAVNLAVEAYKGDLSKAPVVQPDWEKRGWKPVEAIHLGIQAVDTDASNPYQMRGGHFTATNPNFPWNHADAQVLIGNLDGVATLSVAFRGTDEGPDNGFRDFIDYGRFTNHLERFRPLLDALTKFAANDSNGIDRILLSGHSLGGATAQMFLAELKAKYPDLYKITSGVTIGSPGGDTDTSKPIVDNTKFINFMHTDDAVGMIGDYGDALFGGAKMALLYGASNLLTPLGQIMAGYALDSILEGKSRVGPVVRLVINKDDSLGLKEHTRDYYLRSVEAMIEVQGEHKYVKELEFITRAPSTLTKSFDRQFAIGTTKADTIQGEREGEMIFGRDGADKIFADGGDDIIFSGRKADRVQGGTGTDSLQGTVVELAGDRMEDFSGGEKIRVWQQTLSLKDVRFEDNTIWVSKSGKALFDVDVAPSSSLENLFFGLDGKFSVVRGRENDTAYTDIIFTGGIVRKFTNVATATASKGDQSVEWYGGSGADTLLSSTGSDKLGAGAGNDTLDAGGGDDILFAGLSGTKKLRGGDGKDTLDLSEAKVGLKVNLTSGKVTGESVKYAIKSLENVVGTDFSDSIVGDKNANILDGRGGADNLRGGAGNDIYFVNVSGDRVTEKDGEGKDTVNSAVSVNYTSQSVERITLLGVNDIRATGNSLANVLKGNSGDNTLNGKSGNDQLRGYAGNDTLIGGAGADKLDGGNGVDTASYAGAKLGVVANLKTAAANTNDARGDTYTAIENLTGTAYADVLSGNNVANRISGGKGDDAVNGGRGTDTLIGGTGRDIFLFNSKLGSTNIDAIADFSVKDDTICLDDDIFIRAGKVGKLLSVAFFVGGEAADKDDRILYDSKTGKLWYDADGTGSTKAVQFALLDKGLKMTFADFDIIS
ncbi:hypothetical protein GB928_028910 [Shinella curvata]|uniref:Fungal lipase-type domain-containing protein n=1 Tax=Shinella curvata TaxID=1817964 RepID=A0ABT8XN86_9HYPH|nr:hypothetical protein [Shinella curvata]MCJ8057307.1 hypothetical protein [Shinella curvata]MDO6125206.1 hypothetical protein [Shinella curvata]